MIRRVFTPLLPERMGFKNYGHARFLANIQIILFVSAGPCESGPQPLGLDKRSTLPVDVLIRLLQSYTAASRTG